MKNKMYSFLLPIIRFFLRLFCPWTCAGVNNVPDGAVLLCANHTALGDPFYVMCSLKRGEQTHVLAKDEIMNWPLIGLLAKAAGMIGVKRGKSDIAAIKESLRVLKSGEKLLLFPEGTRVKGGQNAEAHTGAAMLATRIGVPIVPIYISPRRPGEKVRVVFGESYIPEYTGNKATPEELRRITDDLMCRIRRLGGED